MTAPIVGRILRWAVPGALLAGLVALVLVDRGGGASLEPAPPLPAPGPGFPRTVELPLGGELDLPAAPRRVVAVTAGLLDVVARLLPAARLAGVPEQALRYSGLGPEDTAVLERPRFTEYAAEPLLALHPDLVLIQPWQSPETSERLREAGVPVVTLAAATDWGDVVAQARLLGRLLGAEAAADRLVEAGRRKLEILAARREARRPLTALAYSNGGAGGWAAGAHTTCDAILRLAGLVNLAGDREGYGPCSYEELLRLDPEVLVVGGAADGVSPGGTSSLLRTTDVLAGLQAVARDHLVELPAALYTTTSQHLLDAALAVSDATAPWAEATGAEPPR